MTKENQNTQSKAATQELSDPAGSPGSARKLLKMAVFWMRKSQDYSPPRPQDVGRMLNCADYIEERLKDNA